MILELITKNIFLSIIIFLGVFSIFLQWLAILSLKGYVKASANMKTTKKKVMINLKNQFEAMHEMKSQVKNMDAYVDKYLLKLRFLGITYSAWEQLPYISAGITAVAMVSGIYYGYTKEAADSYYVGIMCAGGTVLVCLYMFFHIFNIKTRKQQIHIQLVDYLENYLSNRLSRTSENKDAWDDIDRMVEDVRMEESGGDNLPDVSGKESDKSRGFEEDMDMLKRLIREIDAKKEANDVPSEVAATDEEQSDIELLEEFVQSFLS